jgi:hypothetical protein
VAVRAGLWHWSEPGVFGVPLIGIAGWGVFGALFVWFLGLCDRWAARDEGLAWRRLLLPVVSCIAANSLLVVLWWAVFRWLPRGPLPDAVAVGLAVAAGLAFAGRVRGLRGAFPLELAGTRAVSASLFFALIAAVGDRWLLLYALPFAVPYLWLSARWRVGAGAPRVAP